MTSTIPSLSRTNPTIPPALPVVFSPSLHHPFPLPFSPFTIISDRRNCQSYLISFPLCPSSVGMLGERTAGHSWRRHSWEQHSNIPSSSLFTLQFSSAALSHHCFYFIAGSFSFSSRKLDFFSHSFVFLLLTSPNSLPASNLKHFWWFYLGKSP